MDKEKLIKLWKSSVSGSWRYEN